MSLPYTDLQWRHESSDKDLFELAQQRFDVSSTLHDIVLVRCSTDNAQQIAVNDWHARATTEDQRLNIHRRWIPYKCVFLPDTETGRQFQQLAHAIAQVPMQAGVKPENQNQNYWLKTQHCIYQAKGLLIANLIFPLLSKDKHPRKLLQNSVGFRETKKFERLAAVDAALYRLIEAVAPCLKSASATGDGESVVCQLLVDIQQRTFIDEWNAGPANPESALVRPSKQEDWHVEQRHLLEKLIDKARLVPREQVYREELMQTATYWQVLNAAISADSWDQSSNRYRNYVTALRTAKKACVSDISWHHGQPYKLERRDDREPIPPRLKSCSTISKSKADCDCPFRFIGIDLNHSNCLHQSPPPPVEPSRRPSTPQPIRGTIDVHGFIIWIWRLLAL